MSIAVENVREQGNAEIAEAQAIWAQVVTLYKYLVAKNDTSNEKFNICC